MIVVRAPSLIIESLEIESFRAYNKNHPFSFKEPLTVFHGKNGHGKSSTLYAIEWCLFGKIEFLKSLEGKARDEVINQFNPHNMSRVKMTLSNGKQKVVLERSKKSGKAQTQFKLKYDDEELEDSKAEEKLFHLLGMTQDDFIRSVYLHQEAIRDLLTDDQAKRDEALDRLFGLEKLRNIVSGIPVKDVRDEIDELRGKKDKNSQKIQGGIMVAQDQLLKLEQTALDAGVKKEEININAAIKGAGEIIKNIVPLCEDYGISKPDLNSPTNLEEFSSFKSKLKKELKRLESEGIDDEKIANLSSEKRQIEELMADVKGHDDPIKAIEDGMAGIRSKDGERGQIVEKIASIEREVEGENRKRETLDKNAKLVADAIEALKVLTEPICPVCKQDIDISETLRELENRSDKVITEQIEQINEKVSDLTNEKIRLEEVGSRIERLELDLQEERKQQNDSIAELTELLGISKDMAAILEAAANKAGEIQNEVDRLTESGKTKTIRLQAIRDSFDRIGSIVDILNKKDEIGKLREVFSKDDTNEIEAIEKTIVNLESLEGRLEKIVGAVGKVQTSLASDIIKSSGKDIAKFYTDLCMHEHYDQLKIEVKPKENRSGLVRNTYAVKALGSKGKHETHVASRFSTGQMNCVALSVFFALTKTLPMKLGFMMLDDPSQNLDRDHKAALAQIVSGLVPERQIFIATQDREFKDMLQQRNKNGRFYEFTGIDASGPKFN